MKIIKRLHYRKRIDPFIGKNIIKVIVGQRRVGKSYFLRQIMQELEARDPSINIIYINKEQYEFDAIKNYHDLLGFLTEQLKKNQHNAIFIDEIQEIEQFEKALRHLQAEEQHDIYITGSNANLLSGELATFLSGRYIELPVYSLSFPEFMQFHHLQKSTDTLYKYIRYGGLPYLIHLELEDQIIYDYLQNIYASILLKDIVRRHQIRNVAFLESLVKYLATNTGNIISANKISDYLKSQKVSMSPIIVLNYLNYLHESYITTGLKRQEVLGKKIFEIGEKVYFQDLGLKHAIVPYVISLINQVLENLIVNHLLFLGWEVHVGKMGTREIDFVCRRGDEKMYIQSAYRLQSEETIQREFGNLLQIKDNYRKIVISFDEGPNTSYKGIEHMHILDFLCTEE